MFMFEVKDIGWWYWLVTVCLLTAALSGWSDGYLVAIALTAFQIVHYLIREKKISAFPVQVRIGYLLLLLIALPEPMQLIFWIPMIGTWAQVIFGYCTMARFVSMMPWNSKVPFSWASLKKTFLTPPIRGSVLQGHAPIE